MIISGSPAVIRPGQNSINTVCDLISTQLSVPLIPSDISVAHPLPDTQPKDGSPPKKRLIFKLVRRDLKPTIFRACATKKPSFSINESVSKTRSTILFCLRRAHKDYPTKIGKCRTEDCNVKVWVPKASDPRTLEKIEVNTRAQLDRLLSVSANITSAKYVSNWS